VVTYSLSKLLCTLWNFSTSSSV